MKLICNNPIASYQYFLLDKYEAGIVLSGDEIKSVREGHISIKESFVDIKNGECFLKNAYIKSYDKAFFSGKANGERRDRKLLLHKQEIAKLDKSLKEEGLTIVPTRVYFEKSFVKVEIALARGKKLYDKRDAIKDREQARKIRENY